MIDKTVVSKWSGNPAQAIEYVEGEKKKQKGAFCVCIFAYACLARATCPEHCANTQTHIEKEREKEEGEEKLIEREAK